MTLGGRLLVLTANVNVERAIRHSITSHTPPNVSTFPTIHEPHQDTQQRLWKWQFRQFIRRRNYWSHHANKRWHIFGAFVNCIISYWHAKQASITISYQSGISAVRFCSFMGAKSVHSYSQMLSLKSLWLCGTDGVKMSFVRSAKGVIWLVFSLSLTSQITRERWCFATNASERYVTYSILV